MRQAGATLHRGARASHYRGLSCCGAQAPDAQAQQLWLMGLPALRHVGSSRTRAQTRIPCISRQILNHCATREAQFELIFMRDVSPVFSFFFFFFACGYSVVPAPLLEKTILSPLKCFCSFVKGHLTICVDLLLGSLFCSIDVRVYSFTNTVLFGLL